MSTELPPGDVMTSRRLIAKRLGWPDGALEACVELEADFPDWVVFWTRGGLPSDRDPGYRAVLNLHGFVCSLRAETVEGLRDQVATVDADLPRRVFPTPFTPLTYRD